MTTVADRVIVICEQQSGKEAHRGSTLVGDLELDSLDRIELAMCLEDAFGVDIPDNEVDDPKLNSVAALVELIEAKKRSACSVLGINAQQLVRDMEATRYDVNRPGAEL